MHVEDSECEEGVEAETAVQKSIADDVESGTSSVSGHRWCMVFESTFLA